MPDWSYRRSSDPSFPSPDAAPRRSAGSARPRAHAETGSHPSHPGRRKAAECCHRSCAPSALGRLRKNNITQYNMKIKQAILHSSSVFDI